MDAQLSFEEEKIHDELRRIFHSKHFKNAPALRSFLEYVVAVTVAGRGNHLKAYTIATVALGRDPEFDSANDTIVRTTAVRVRKALVAYNSERSADSRVVINLPKGRYTPSFEFQTTSSEFRRKISSRLSFVRVLVARKVILVSAIFLTTAATAIAAIFLDRGANASIHQSALINVQPVNYVNQETQSLARKIDARLAPALSRLRLAEIIPLDDMSARGEVSAPAVKPENHNAISFTLRSNLTGGVNPTLYWRLVDTASDHIVWTSKERFLKTDAALLDEKVDKIAFQILGIGGAVPLAFERYRGKLFTKPTCISRAQIMRTAENNAVYPEIRACLEETAANEPNDASVWAVLSAFYTNRSYFYTAGSFEERATMVKRAERAVEYAATLAPEAYLTKVALMKLALRQQRVEVFNTLQLEIRTDYPGDIYLQIRIATRLARLGYGMEALEIFFNARNNFGINLKNWAPGIAVAHYSNKDYTSAYQEILRTTSDLRFVLVLKAAILGKLGMVDKAKPILTKLTTTYPNISERFYPWLTDISWTEALVIDVADGLAKAGLVVDIPTST